ARELAARIRHGVFPCGDPVLGQPKAFAQRTPRHCSDLQGAIGQAQADSTPKWRGRPGSANLLWARREAVQYCARTGAVRRLRGPIPVRLSWTAVAPPAARSFAVR